MSGSLVMIPLSLNPGLLSRTTPRSVYGAKPPSIVGNGGLDPQFVGVLDLQTTSWGLTCHQRYLQSRTPKGEWKNWFSAMFSKVFVAFVGNGRHWGLDQQSNGKV